MRFETQTCIREQRDALDRVRKEFTAASSMTADNAKRLFNIYENAVKTPIIEHYGNIPHGSFRTHDLPALCQTYGVWNTLPSSLQVAIGDINPFWSVRYTTEAAYKTLVTSSNPQQWADRIQAAERILDFMEIQVIADPTTFSRLTL